MVEGCIYKVLDAGAFAELQREGSYAGSAVDQRDGYVHLSTREQLRETLSRHYAGRGELAVLSVDPAGLGDLRWEPSRGGALFPHLYGPLPAAAVRDVLWVEVDAAGVSTLPVGFP